MNIKNELITSLDFYRIVWDRISCETNLLNQKLSTLINSQAFLFLGYVTLLNSPQNLRSDFLGIQHHVLLWLFPIAALLTAIFMYGSMISSYLHIRGLVECYQGVPEKYKIADIPSISFNNKLLSISNSTIIVLPIFFSITWLIMVGYQWFLEG